jgi:hypothetical protein
MLTMGRWRSSRLVNAAGGAVSGGLLGKRAKRRTARNSFAYLAAVRNPGPGAILRTGKGRAITSDGGGGGLRYG